MKSTGKSWLSGTGMLLLAALVQADVTDLKDHPYRVILDRNPFGLQDPPPPTPTLTNPPPVKVDVKFTGITSDGSSKRAWLMIPSGPGRAQPKYFSAAEGGGEDDITVLEINENETTVKILNAGVPVVLNFKDNGMAAPPPLAVPGAQPGLLPGGVPRPGMVPAPVTPPSGLPGVRTASGTPYVPTPSVTPGMVSQPPVNQSLRQIPARNLRTTPVEPQQQVDPAVQYLNMRLQAEKARAEGVPFPPVPPLPGVPSE